MRLLSKGGRKLLMSNGEIRQTNNGYVSADGEFVTMYRTCHGKYYTEDKYCDIAEELRKETVGKS